MARKKAILILGQSNADGTAPASEFSDEDFRRWFGKTLAEITLDPLLLSGPGVPGPGLKFFQVRMPVQTPGPGTNTAAATLAGGTGAFAGNATIDTGSATSAADVGKWVTVNSGGTPEFGRIVAQAGNVWTLDRPFTAINPAGGEAYWVSNGSTGTHDASNIQGRWDYLRYRLSGDFFWTDGYEYPTHRGGGRPRGTPFAYGANLNHGPEIEIAWQMQRDLGEEVHVIKCAAGSSYFGRHLTKIGLPSHSWYDNERTISWHPLMEGTDPFPATTAHAEVEGLFGAAKNMVTAAGGALAAGDQLDIVAVFVKQGESDTLNDYNANNVYENAGLFRSELRKFLKENDYVTCREEQIPVIWTGHNTAFWPSPNVETVNSALQQLAEEDLATDYAGDSTNYERRVGDEGHMTGPGYNQMAQDWFLGYKRVKRSLEESAPPRAARVTLGEVRDEVLLRFERNQVSTSTSDTVANLYINSAYRDILNTLGDKAWFLRQTYVTTVNSYPATTVLPDFVRRVIRIERESHPDAEISFKLMDYTSSGQARISVKQNPGGAVRIHYFRNWPVDVSGDDESFYLPLEYKELLVIAACKRMSEAFGNAELAKYYSFELERLWKYVKRDCLRYDRAKNAQLNSWDAYDHNIGGPQPNWLSKL